MKKLIILEQIIYDYIEKKVNVFNFKSSVNLFVSKGNTIGKSSLMKSIYFTLGYSIKIFPSGWNQNNMLFKIKVQHNNTDFSITRHQNLFYINDSPSPLTEKEYSLWLQDILDMKILLKEKQSKELKTVYASEVLLPFYIDQDKSWTGFLYKNTADSFGRYSDIPKGVFEYYIGISNNKILQLEQQKSNLNTEVKKIELKQQALKMLEDEQTITSSKKGVTLSIDEYQSEINIYINKLNTISEIISKHNTNIFNTQKSIDVCKNEIIELNKLLTMYNERFKNIQHTCIYCKSNLTHEQSLSRLKIRNNLFDITNLLNSKNIELADLNLKNRKLLDLKDSITNKYTSIKDSIGYLKKSSDINEYIESETNKKIAANYLQIEHSIASELILKMNSRKEINKLISKFKKEINQLTIDSENTYNQLKNKIPLELTEINLTDIGFLDFKEILSSGNDANKKILALYVIYSKLVDQYSHVKVPIGMDSFIKNETTISLKQEMFPFVYKNLFSLNKQIFFSIIEENLQFLEDLSKFNLIRIEKPILHPIDSSNSYLLDEFQFIVNN